METDRMESFGANGKGVVVPRTPSLRRRSGRDGSSVISMAAKKIDASSSKIFEDKAPASSITDSLRAIVIASKAAMKFRDCSFPSEDKAQGVDKSCAKEKATSGVPDCPITKSPASPSTQNEASETRPLMDHPNMSPASLRREQNVKKATSGVPASPITGCTCVGSPSTRNEPSLTRPLMDDSNVSTAPPRREQNVKVDRRLCQRVLALLSLILEIASYVLDILGKDRKLFVLATLVLSVINFGLCCETIYAFYMRRTRWSRRLVGILEILFSLFQMVVSLVHFILVLLRGNSAPPIPSPVPLVFALFVLCFYMFYNDSSEGSPETRADTELCLLETEVRIPSSPASVASLVAPTICGVHQQYPLRNVKVHMPGTSVQELSDMIISNCNEQFMEKVKETDNIEGITWKLVPIKDEGMAS